MGYQQELHEQPGGSVSSASPPWSGRNPGGRPLARVSNAHRRPTGPLAAVCRRVYMVWAWLRAYPPSCTTLDHQWTASYPAFDTAHSRAHLAPADVVQRGGAPMPPSQRRLATLLSCILCIVLSQSYYDFPASPTQRLLPRFCLPPLLRSPKIGPTMTDQNQLRQVRRGTGGRGRAAQVCWAAGAIREVEADSKNAHRQRTLAHVGWQSRRLVAPPAPPARQHRLCPTGTGDGELHPPFKRGSRV